LERVRRRAGDPANWKGGPGATGKKERGSSRGTRPFIRLTGGEKRKEGRLRDGKRKKGEGREKSCASAQGEKERKD